VTKLEEMRRRYDIPEAPYLPMGKVVLVFRMPVEEKTAGGLFVPATNAEPKQYGVLVAAGLQAREIMRDALIEIGDVVWFGRFEGQEKEISREIAEKGRYLLQMKVEGVLGSVDALKRVDSYDVATDEEGNLSYQRKTIMKGRANGHRERRPV
jgi:co-chaperonin GroES (HSP10)